MLGAVLPQQTELLDQIVAGLKTAPRSQPRETIHGDLRSLAQRIVVNLELAT